MKRFAIACVAVVGLMLVGSSAANAGGFGFSVGHGGYSGGHGGYSGGHGGFSGGHGNYYGGHGYTPHVYGHRTIHHNTFPSYGTHGYGYINTLHGGYSNVHHGGYLGH